MNLIKENRKVLLQLPDDDVRWEVGISLKRIESFLVLVFRVLFMVRYESH